MQWTACLLVVPVVKVIHNHQLSHLITQDSFCCRKCNTVLLYSVYVSLPPPLLNFFFIIFDLKSIHFFLTLQSIMLMPRQINNIMVILISEKLIDTHDSTDYFSGILWQHIGYLRILTHLWHPLFLAISLLSSWLSPPCPVCCSIPQIISHSWQSLASQESSDQGY